jgi:ribosomal protein S7
VAQSVEQRDATVEVKSRRVGGATFRFRLKCALDRRDSGTWWMIQYTRRRGENHEGYWLAKSSLLLKTAKVLAVKKKKTTPTA